MTFKNAYRRLEDVNILLIKDEETGYILQPYGRGRRTLLRTKDLDFVVKAGTEMNRLLTEPSK